MELLLLSGDSGDHEHGDVIDIRPDGFNWGALEQEDPMFEIVTVPDEDVAEILSEGLGVVDDGDPIIVNDAPEPAVSRSRWNLSGGSLRRRTISRDSGNKPLVEIAQHRVVPVTPTPQQRRRAPRGPGGRGRPPGYAPPRPVDGRIE